MAKITEDEKQEVRKKMLTDLGLLNSQDRCFEMKDLGEEHEGLVVLIRACMENALEYTAINDCRVEYWAARVVDLMAAEKCTRELLEGE